MVTSFIIWNVFSIAVTNTTTSINKTASGKNYIKVVYILPLHKKPLILKKLTLLTFLFSIQGNIPHPDISNDCVAYQEAKKGQSDSFFFVPISGK